jgi:Tol biopolymer transport system component/DNA-binding winged helix-turn-helix (wHTH) protein
MSLTGFSLFSAHCAADVTPDAAAKSYEHPKETLRNFMRNSGRIHGAAMSLQTKHIYEFGPFRLDAGEHLLLRDGEAVPLTPKAFDLLVALIERHGRLLEKEELLKKVWPDTFVEEANLASNISQLRKALGDGENGQRFIETAPKRGYRFVANVKKVEDEREEPRIQEQSRSQNTVAEGEQAANGGELITEYQALKAESLKIKIKRHSRSLLFALATLIFLSAGLLYFILKSPTPLKVKASAPITRDGLPKVHTSFIFWSSSLVTDGPRLFFSEGVGGHWVIAQVSSAGGETVVIPTSFSTAFLRDISPDRSELLVESGAGGPLWALPVLGSAPRRIGNVMSHAAAWSFDGQQIVYANGSTLYLAKSDGTESRKLKTVTGRPYWLRWSPDGSYLRFTVRDTDLGSLHSLWEVAADGSNLHPLLPDWNKPANECCGNWTSDGRYFVFQSTRNGTTNIWAMREQAGFFRRASSEPVQLTVGPLNYYTPVPSQDGKKLFVVGEQQRGELARYDMKTQQWASYLPGISAEHLDFSRDGARVVYVTYPEGNLWQSKVDGSERLQLTGPPMRSGLPRWSPDGKQIVFTARVPGKPWKAYLISAEGGTPQQLMPEESAELDPGWSPDGKTLVFEDYDAKTILLLDLSTRHISTLPDSKGYYSPRWSPDGRYIAAIPSGSKDKLLLFDFTTQRWTELAKQRTGWPQWSQDGKYIYFHTSIPDDSALYRVRIDDRKLERLVSTKDLRRAGSGGFGPWIGWTSDDSPLVLRDVGTQDIYALEWQTP